MGKAARDHAGSGCDARGGRAWKFVGLGAGFVAAALALTGIFSGAEWYADRVSMARYCDNPEAAAELVHRILTEARPADATATRPYVVAAKLLYLKPQREGEDTTAYVARLRGEIEGNCR